VECESSAPREIRSLLLQEVASAHLHFARVQQKESPEEEAVLERVLTSAEPSWRLAPESGADDDAPTAGSSLGSYVLIGISHIGTGPDHLAFVLALILIAARIGELATVITGFTVAHSITLAVAAFGLAKPEAQEIGALVGLSIILVAAENTYLLSGRPRSIPRVLTAGLGVTALLAALGFGGMGALTLAGMTLFTLCYFELLGRAERPARLSPSPSHSAWCTASASRGCWWRSPCRPTDSCPRFSASIWVSRWASWCWSPRSGPSCATWRGCARADLTASWSRSARRPCAAWGCSGSSPAPSGSRS
jgi:hypothetical protein